LLESFCILQFISYSMIQLCYANLHYIAKSHYSCIFNNMVIARQQVNRFAKSLYSIIMKSSHAKPRLHFEEVRTAWLIDCPNFSHTHILPHFTLFVLCYKLQITPVRNPIDKLKDMTQMHVCKWKASIFSILITLPACIAYNNVIII